MEQNSHAAETGLLPQETIIIVKSKDPVWMDRLRPVVAEAIGLLIFVFIGTCQATSGGGVTAAALAHGFCIALMIIGIGRISGGHFNPAVTLGIFLSGEISWLMAILYVLGQLVGSVFGAVLARAVLTHDKYILDRVTGLTSVAFTFTTEGAVNPNYPVLSIILCEIILTFVLVITVLMAAVDGGERNVLAPLAIGLAVLVDILAGGNISGASMNPARSFGPALAYSFFGGEHATSFCPPNSTAPCILEVKYHWYYHYVYWVGPLIGGALAAILYKLILAPSEKRWFWRLYGRNKA